MILNSMLENSPIALVAISGLTLLAYGIASAAAAFGRLLRRPRRS